MPHRPPPAPPGSALLTGHLSLQTPLGGVLTDQRVRLLEAIHEVGSLNRAARQVPLSYKAAWDALDTMNALSPQPLVERSTGGKGGGGTRLTDYAHQLIRLYRAMQSSQQGVLDRLPELPPEGDMPQLRTLVRQLTMRTSARNQFAGRIAALADRGGLVDVVLALDTPGRLAPPDAAGSTGGAGSAGADRITATITPESAAEMALRLGDALHALIKAPWVSVSPDEPAASPDHNRLPGRVLALRPGSLHTGCTLQLPSGRVIHAVVPDTLAARLPPGAAAWAVFPSESVVLVSFA